MSCNKHKDITDQIKGFSDLKKHFDIVELDTSREKYNLLTCKDKVKKSNSVIEYETWLSLPIRKKYDDINSYVNHEDTEYVEDCIMSILLWISILKKDKPQASTQLSLFDNEDEIILESEPQVPSGNKSDSSWNGYHLKLHNVRKNNLMKQYSFLELFDSDGYWKYFTEDNYYKFPTKEEVLNIIKEGIVKYKNNSGRHDDVWNDDYGYITEDGPLSDVELFTRVFNVYRFFIRPYTMYAHLDYDSSYKLSEHKERTEYRFYYDYGRLCSSSFHDMEDIEYDYFTGEFCQWLRDIYKVDYVKALNDDEIQKIAIEEFFRYVKDFSICDEVNKHKDLKEFKKAMKPYIQKSNEESSGSFIGAIDGYKGHISREGTKSKIEISQKLKYRKYIAYYDVSEENINDKEINIVSLINMNEILEKAFELFKEDTQTQLTLF